MQAAVDADLMACVDDPPHQVWVSAGVFVEQEERGVRSRARKDIEQPRRVPLARTVVERDRESIVHALDAIQHVVPVFDGESMEESHEPTAVSDATKSCRA